MVTTLNAGHVIESPGNINEGLFLEAMIKSLRHTPETIIIGSSHIMYEPWQFQDFYVAGLSGAYLGDYYAIIGLLEETDRLPSHIIIGVDPWAFMTSASNGRHTSIAQYAQK